MKKLRAALAALSAVWVILSPITSLATAEPVPLRMAVDASCVRGGGIQIVLRLQNLGQERLRIDPNFHVTVDVVGSRGREERLIAFVFPAPGFAVIRPGETVRFRLVLGDPEPGEDPIDLSGRRLLLETQIFFAGTERAAIKTFSVPGC